MFYTPKYQVPTEKLDECADGVWTELTTHAKASMPGKTGDRKQSRLD